MTDVDHLVYGAPDLEAGIQCLEARVGIRAVEGGRHARWGTRNALLALGDRSYLEVLAPDPERWRSGAPTLFGLGTLAAPRLVAWATKVDYLEARVDAAARRGVELGPVLGGTRERPDGTLLSWRLTDPEVLLGDGVVPFLIDWGGTPHPAIGAPRAGSLLTLRAEHPDPVRVRQLLEAVGVRLHVDRGSEPALIARIRTVMGEIELR